MLSLLTTLFALVLPGASSRPAVCDSGTAPAFAIQDFFIGSLSGNTTIVSFAIQPTIGVDFTACSLNTVVDPSISPIPRTPCREVPTISWSLEAVYGEDGDGGGDDGGDGGVMRLQLWWRFSDIAALWGERFIPEEEFVAVSDSVGGVRLYSGPQEFRVESETVWAWDTRDS